MSPDGYARVARLAALGDRSAMAAALEQIAAPPADIAAMLRAHHVSGLVRGSLDETAVGVCPGLLAALDAVRPVQTATAGEFLALFDEVRVRLEAAGVPVLLLKGRYFADRLYGAAVQRPQFDVDVLVPHRAHRRAGRLLGDAGFERVAYDLHSRTFARRGLKVDVHQYLRWAPAYGIREAEIWTSAQTIRVGDLEARTLSDEYCLVLLALGAFEDLGQGMARLKQLLDLYLLLRQVDATFDWERFFARRRRENLEGVTGSVLAIAVSLFAVSSELPRLAAALMARGHVCDEDARRLALELTFARRKAPASLAWFKRVYPGTLSWYLWWFWLAGFPANLRGEGAGRFAETLRVAAGR